MEEHNHGTSTYWMEDDGTTLTAPNGHTVIQGFRGWVLTHAPWGLCQCSTGRGGISQPRRGLLQSGGQWRDTATLYLL